MRGRRSAAVALVVLALAGCGSASDPSPPAGVDELVIPTPSPDPADFADTITNPWLPLAVGTEWRYRDAERAREITITAEKGPEIAGVATTALRTRSGSRETLDYYAQDRDGNVWWFGHSGDAAAWRAGEDDALAGLAMAATPRFGDGYREGLAPGASEPRSRVDALDAEIEVPAGEYDGVLLIESTLPGTGAAPDQVVESAYARGIGLVRRTGPDTALELVAYDEPQR